MDTKLLIIEDELQIRQNLAELLTLKGFTVESSTNGREGIEHALVFKPDLILCDVMMPELNGYQVLEAIRSDHPSLSGVPFIFLTAKADKSDFRLGMNLGADDYLTKPFTSADLLAAIESRLKHRQQWVAQPKPANDYLTTLKASNNRGSMILRTDDCFYFFTEQRGYYVLHEQGTFQVENSLEELTTRLNPLLFFRINRKEIVNRNVVQHYAYWEKGKYCLFLLIKGEQKEVILPRARFRPFLDWLKAD
jgi:two-component system OmpR family response regulator